MSVPSFEQDHQSTEEPKPSILSEEDKRQLRREERARRRAELTDNMPSSAPSPSTQDTSTPLQPNKTPPSVAYDRQRREEQIRRLREERDRLVALEQERKRREEEEKAMREEMERIRRKAEEKRKAEMEKRRKNEEEEKKLLERITQQRREVEQRQRREREMLKREAEERKRSPSPMIHEEVDLQRKASFEDEVVGDLNHFTIGSEMGPKNGEEAGSAVRGNNNVVIPSSNTAVPSNDPMVPKDTNSSEPVRIPVTTLSNSTKNDFSSHEESHQPKVMASSTSFFSSLFSSKRSPPSQPVHSDLPPKVSPISTSNFSENVPNSISLLNASIDPFDEDSSSSFPSPPNRSPSPPRQNPFGRESEVLQRLSNPDQTKPERKVITLSNMFDNHNPFDETSDNSPRNPFDEEPSNRFVHETPESPQNPFDLDVKESVVLKLNPFDETPNDSPRNPFDEEISRKNPFDETPTPPRNPFDEEVKTPPIKLNPFDDTSEDLSPVEPPLNPFNEIPSSSKKSSPEISPISVSDSFDKLESAAEQKELKAKQQLVSESINDQNAPVEADMQTDDTNDETPERKRERSELMSMMQVYKTNPDGSRARRRMICRVERVFDAVSVRH